MPERDPRGLGDLVEAALAFVGITKQRIEKWLGRPCNCDDRQQKLNQVSAWAKRVINGRTSNAQQYLDAIIGVDSSPSQLSDTRENDDKPKDGDNSVR